MALGSSAPEIMLSVIETLTTLDSTPGELGPSTIVGSAAFNLMVISAVSIIAVPSGQVKKINDLGVFAVTAIASIFAYVWMYICLEVWTKGVITIIEGCLTLFFFILLLVMAFGADKFNEWRQRKKGVQKTYGKQFSLEDYYHIINAKKGGATTEKDDTTAKENHDIQDKHRELQQYLKETFGTDDITSIDPKQVKDALKPRSVVERVSYRRQVGNAFQGQHSQNLVVVKGMKHIQEEKQAKDELKEHELNDTIGFRCIHYSVTESIGIAKILVVNKKKEGIKFGIRSIDDTALAGDDFEGVDQVVELKEGEAEYTQEIKIMDDDQWEPDEHFYLELYDPETKERLEGEDTKTMITIIDDDEPGQLSFQQRAIKVRAKDKQVKIKLLRQNGSDGVIQVKFETTTPDTLTNPATAYEDYLPKSGVVEFGQGETEKEICIDILDKETSEEARFDVFAIKLFEPEGGALISSKRDQLFVEIVGDEEVVSSMKGIENLIELMQNESDTTYIG